MLLSSIKLMEMWLQTTVVKHSTSRELKLFSKQCLPCVSGEIPLKFWQIFKPQKLKENLPFELKQKLSQKANFFWLLGCLQFQKKWQNHL